MTYSETKLQNIYNKLQMLLFQLKKICCSKIGAIPAQINKIVIGTDKLRTFIEDNVAYDLTENDLKYMTIINADPFLECYNLKSITIPDSVGIIDYGAFQSCYSLKSITIPDSVTSIGNNALPSAAVIYCNKNSFAESYCKERYYYILLDGTDEENTVSGKAGQCVWNFNKITQILEITGNGEMTDSYDSIVGYFYKNYVLEAIILDGVTTIGARAFSDCQNLINVTIPNSVKTIQSDAFRYCTSLASISIPNSVTYIFSDAFNGCKNLTAIYLNSTTPPNLGSTSAIPTTTTIYVPVGSGEAYRNATNWSYHATRIIEDPEL